MSGDPFANYSSMLSSATNPSLSKPTANMTNATSPREQRTSPDNQDSHPSTPVAEALPELDPTESSWDILSLSTPSLPSPKAIIDTNDPIQADYYITCPQYPSDDTRPPSSPTPRALSRPPLSDPLVPLATSEHPSPLNPDILDHNIPADLDLTDESTVPPSTATSNTTATNYNPPCTHQDNTCTCIVTARLLAFQAHLERLVMSRQEDQRRGMLVFPPRPPVQVGGETIDLDQLDAMPRGVR